MTIRSIFFPVCSTGLCKTLEELGLTKPLDIFVINPIYDSDLSTLKTPFSQIAMLDLKTAINDAIHQLDDPNCDKRLIELYNSATEKRFGLRPDLARINTLFSENNSHLLLFERDLDNFSSKELSLNAKVELKFNNQTVIAPARSLEEDQLFSLLNGSLRV